MKILILGGNGMLGPWAVRAMKDRHEILLTDINEPHPNYKGDYLQLSVSDVDGVIKAAEGKVFIYKEIEITAPAPEPPKRYNLYGEYE